jgi:hypothetical protein
MPLRFGRSKNGSDSRVQVGAGLGTQAGLARKFRAGDIGA